MPKIAVCGVEVGAINPSESIRLSPTINIEDGHIHNTCEMVFRSKNYRRNTVEMALLQKYQNYY